MSGFDLAWLDLREPADHAARDGGLLAAAAVLVDAAARPLVVDLGCGSGSTLRALGPRLARPAAWRLVDHDPALLRAAARRAGAPCEAVEADLADAARLPLAGAALVTASALLDLVSADWIAALADALDGAPLYAALTYEGRMAWAEAHPLDAAVTEAFNAHQGGDKGFGPALGPAAAWAAARTLEARGYAVRLAQSPWRLGPAEAALERGLIEGVAAAAIEAGLAEAADWRAARIALAGRGCVVGHQDLLATPS